MNTKKELNLKLSADSFDIKSLEIKDGKLELVLTAYIDNTEIDNTQINEPAAEITPAAEEFINNEVNFSSPLLGKSTETETETHARYGEPVADVEWQAVNDDSDYEEVEENVSAEEFEAQNETEADINPELEQIDMVKTENDQNFTNAGTETETENQDDVLPDYLKFSDSASENKTKPDAASTSVFDQIKSPDEIPTVRFEREKKDIEDSPEKQQESFTANNEMPQPENVENTESQDNTLHTADKPKMVKFLCPRCHTPGSQTIQSVGNIITCANCGRALKLNIKR